MNRGSRQVDNRTPFHIERAVVNIRRRLPAQATLTTRYSQPNFTRWRGKGQNPCQPHQNPDEGSHSFETPDWFVERRYMVTFSSARKSWVFCSLSLDLLSQFLLLAFSPVVCYQVRPRLLVSRITAKCSSLIRHSLKSFLTACASLLDWCHSTSG